MRVMKDSGIAWIGEIPENWKMVQVRYLFRIGRGRVISQTELQDNGIYPVFSSQTKDNGCLGYINTYDFDISQLTWTTDGANAGTVFLRSGKHNCTNVCGTLQPLNAEIDLRFQKYALEHIAYYHKRADTNGFKIMNNEMANIYTILPPLNTQRRIADYLDRKCSQIDAIIARQQEVIEKLKAYKLSVITEAVTKGLNPHAPMKDSGVEWIGEIPEHWNLIKATRIIISTQNGLTRRDLDKSSGQLVLKLRNISSTGEIDYEYQNRIELTNQELETYCLKDGDFLFVRVNGSKSLVGKCAIFYSVGENVAYNDHIIRVRISGRCIEKFFFWFLLSTCGKVEIDLHTSTSAGQYTISGEGLRDIRMVLPPRTEQIEIDVFLSKVCSNIDKLIIRKQTAIDKLAAYKKSLIYEVVTGKKEV